MSFCLLVWHCGCPTAKSKYRRVLLDRNHSSSCNYQSNPLNDVCIQQRINGGTHLYSYYIQSTDRDCNPRADFLTWRNGSMQPGFVYKKNPESSSQNVNIKFPYAHQSITPETFDRRQNTVAQIIDEICDL